MKLSIIITAVVAATAVAVTAKTFSYHAGTKTTGSVKTDSVLKTVHCIAAVITGAAITTSVMDILNDSAE